MTSARRLAIALAALLASTASLTVHADTRSTIGDSSGEGSGPFAGAVSSPAANPFTGAMGLSVPILVPPGRGNLTPDLKLVYSSDAGQSPFGFGWDLPIGRIERNTKYGRPNCATHMDDFVLSLNGAMVELVPIGANKYRARIDESWLEAQAFPGENRWELHDRAGNLYHFGQQSSSRLFAVEETFYLPPGGSNPDCKFTGVWALEEIRDPNGNQIKISYGKFNGTLYPATIDYGGNAALMGGKHPFRIVFYARPTERPHPASSYRRGFLEEIKYAFETIHVTTSTDGINFSVLRKYTLNQQDVDENGRTLLASVAVADAAGALLVPTRTFEYSTSAFRHLSDPSAQAPPIDKHREGATGRGEAWVTTLDMNGDGRLDQVYTPSPGIGWWDVYERMPDGSFQARKWKLPTGEGFRLRHTQGNGVNSWVEYDTVDLTGDGFADLIDARQSVYAATGGWKVYPGRVSQQQGFDYEFSPSAEIWPGAYPNTESQETRTYDTYTTRTHIDKMLLDVNGDGKLDVVWVANPDQPATPWNVLINSDSCATTEHCFVTDSNFRAEGPIRTSLTFAHSEAGGAYQVTAVVRDHFDMNGDGLPDRVESSPARSWAHFGRNLYFNGDTGAGIYYDVNSCGSLSTHAFLMCASTSGLLYVANNSGSGFVAVEPDAAQPSYLGTRGNHLGIRVEQRDGSVHTALQDFADVNGDGLPDRLRLQGSSLFVQLNRGGALEPAERLWSGLNGTTRFYTDTGYTIAQRGDLLDWNSDGLLDSVYISGPGAVAAVLATPDDGTQQAGHGVLPNLLVKAFDGLGGVTEVRYAPSTSTAAGSNPELPFVKWVATKIRQTDGLCVPTGDPFNQQTNSCLTTGHEIQKELSYDDGRFDAATREFRGFETVRETDADGSYREITFSQSDFTRGKVLSEAVYASNGLEVKRSEFSWSSLSGANGRTQVYLAQSKMIERDPGGPGATDWCVVNRNEPPDAFGRVTKSCTLDCASGITSCGATLAEGEVRTTTNWTSPPAGSASTVYERPATITVLSRPVGGTTSTLSQKNFSYDEQAHSAVLTVGTGNLTRTESVMAAMPWPASESDYDAYGNVTASIDPRGNPTTSDFSGFRLYPDAVHRPNTGVAHTTAYEWNIGVGKPSVVTGENNEQTVLEYDALGRITCEAKPGDVCAAGSPGLASVRYSYRYAPPSGTGFEGKLSYVEVRRREPNSPNGFLVSRTYLDALGRQRFSTSETVIGSNPTLQIVVSRQTHFSKTGRPERVYTSYLKPGGGVVETPSGVGYEQIDYQLNQYAVVDPLGRPHRRSPPDARWVETTYKGRLVETVDSAGSKVAVTRDHLGHAIAEERSGPGATPMRFDRKFDGMGRLLWVQTSNNARTVVTHSYDRLGRLVQTVDPDSGTWSFGYDTSGNLVDRDDPKASQHVEWAYDALDRVTARCSYATDTYSGMCAPFTSEAESSYLYDQNANGIGRLTQVESGGSRSDFERFFYDARGRVWRTETNIQGKQAAMEFGYDAADHVTDILYPGANSEVLTHVFDAAGRVVQMSSQAAVYVTSARYDLFGRLEEVVHGNQVTDHFDYYGAAESQRLQRIHTSSAFEDIVNLTYSYVPTGQLGAGKVDTVVDARDAGAQQTTSNDGDFEYDGLGRLLQVTGPTPETFAYDAIGNLTAKNGVTLSYPQTGPNPHRIASAGSTPYQFDTNGSQWKRGSGATEQIYTHDELGRLVSIAAPAGTLGFSYDWSDRRITKTRPDGSTIRYFNRYAESRDGRLIKFFWLGERMIASHDVPAVDLSELPPGMPRPSPPWLAPLLLAVFGGVVLLIVFAPGSGERRVYVWVAPARAAGTATLLLLGSTPLLLAPQCGGEPVMRHFHLDHLGSVVAKTNDAGGLVTQIRYRAYGDERGHYANGGGVIPVSATGADRHEWTGYEAEHEASLAYAGARYYDPAIGQFLSHDPLRQYASPYAYGPGDPMNGRDPSGAGFLETIGDFFSSVRDVLRSVDEAIDGVLPSNVSIGGGVGYSMSFGEESRSGARPGLGSQSDGTSRMNESTNRLMEETLAGLVAGELMSAGLGSGAIETAVSIAMSAAGERLSPPSAGLQKRMHDEELAKIRAAGVFEPGYDPEFIAGYAVYRVTEGRRLLGSERTVSMETAAMMVASGGWHHAAGLSDPGPRIRIFSGAFSARREGVEGNLTPREAIRMTLFHEYYHYLHPTLHGPPAEARARAYAAQRYARQY